MKKRLQGLVAGILIGATVTGGVVFGANTTTLYNVIANGIKIVIDGQKLNPTDVNGNKVEPIIYNGTTYLPVRAVANAIGKPVYWDGPNFTVYLGDMNGNLEYPTEELSCEGNIGDDWDDTSDLKDNLGNIYSRGINPYYGGDTFEKILNMKYSRFKGTIYVTDGTDSDQSVQFAIKTDGKTVYTSPEITKKSQPIDFDIDVSGCYDLQIVFTKNSSSWDMVTWAKIGNGGFYQ